jgi:UDPglucose 6-dehydrogenase
MAAVSERGGADAHDVARGLKTERRIGPAAYLNPGAAFAGGTLARDIAFLKTLGASTGTSTAIIDGVQASNRAHRGWTAQRLSRELGTIAARRVAVWGLTYKPGTDTLRRSESIALCRWLVQQQAHVRVHDPLAAALPDDLQPAIARESDPVTAAQSADALIVATEWPIYREVDRDRLAAAMHNRLVLDPNRFLGGTLGADPRFTLVAVGQPAA